MIALPYLVGGAALAGAAAGGLGAWWLTDLASVAELAHCQLEAAAQDTTRTEQARRAIQTVRDGERAHVVEQAGIDAALAADRRAVATALADRTDQRLRGPSAPATGPIAARVPEARSDAGGCLRADIVQRIEQIRAEDERDAAAADDTAARLTACYRRLRADRALINGTDR